MRGRGRSNTAAAVATSGSGSDGGGGATGSSGGARSTSNDTGTAVEARTGAGQGSRVAATKTRLWAATDRTKTAGRTQGRSHEPPGDTKEEAAGTTGTGVRTEAYRSISAPRLVAVFRTRLPTSENGSENRSQTVSNHERRALRSQASTREEFATAQGDGVSTARGGAPSTAGKYVCISPSACPGSIPVPS